MKFSLILLLGLCTSVAVAQNQPKNPKTTDALKTSSAPKLAEVPSPSKTKFPYGDGIDKWGLPLKVPDSELSLRIGGRIQGLATIKTTEDLDNDTETTYQDFQARRVRLQFQADLGKRASFVMDLRNDNANQKDEGEKTFNVGDAYVHIPLNSDMSHVVRLYRAKVDMSRTQTTSSSELIWLNRAYIADEAASFISHQRRATNAQLLGHFNKKASYQLVIGDGIASDRFTDAEGDKLALGSIQKQNFMVGGKLRLHPFEGWEEKVTETYFGVGKHASVGAGIFNTSKIHYEVGNNKDTLSRTLVNVEASAHYEAFAIQAEYFKLNGVVEDFSATDINQGSGEGYYVQGEYVLVDLEYFAPFARYEFWDRFQESGDYESWHSLYGLNWYLNGNRFRVGVAYERNLLGRDIEGGKERVEAYHLSSMWHF